MLEEHLVARGEVDYELRACERGEGAGRNRSPEILAYLDGEGQGAVFRTEQLVSLEGDVLLSGIVYDSTFGRQHPRGLEPAGLVELRAAGKVGLGNYSEYFPAAGDDGAVEKPAPEPYGRAEDEDRRQLGGLLQNAGYGGFRVPCQHSLPEQVCAGVARDAELRKGYYASSEAAQFSCKRDRLAGVRPAVSDMDMRHRGRDPDESEILHLKSIFCKSRNLMAKNV